MKRFSITSALFLYSSIAAAGGPFYLNFNGVPPSEPELRISKVQQSVAPFPVSRVGDIAFANWYNPGGSLGNTRWHGDYAKISITGSLQWSETIFYNSSFDTPLMIDTGRDGFSFGGEDTAIWFDLSDSGEKSYFQWLQQNTNDAFLGRDLNFNGEIDNGSELFGSGTDLVTKGRKARNGYEAIQQYDTAALGGDQDGFLSSNDAEWTKLKLWFDANANGLTDEGEIHNLEEFSIYKISVNPRVSKRKKDRYGNLLPYWSWVTTIPDQGPSKLKMVDVYFKRSDAYPGG